jgi:site-specific DNA-methyltransferase (adenine-specific)
LLERIVSASSNPGDVVLDPFCGCGTAIDAAQKLGRQWIGIDVTHLAIGLVEKRLREAYGDTARWETIGVPKDLASAQRLAEEKPHDFQNWICLQLGGWPWMGGKKGGDKGVDGYFYYVGEGGQTETGVISVKAGHNVNPNMVRDLGRVMQRDGHKLGLFVSAALPTKGMEAEANSHEPVETEFGRFPALQIFTLAELFQGPEAEAAAAGQSEPEGSARGNSCEPPEGFAGRVAIRARQKRAGGSPDGLRGSHPREVGDDLNLWRWPPSPSRQLTLGETTDQPYR